MVSKAMARLEVGQISVVNFGKEVQLLHPFERPFTDDAGASFMSQMTFAQKETNYEAALEGIVEMLDLARKEVGFFSRFKIFASFCPLYFAPLMYFFLSFFPPSKGTFIELNNCCRIYAASLHRLRRAHTRQPRQRQGEFSFVCANKHKMLVQYQQGLK